MQHLIHEKPHFLMQIVTKIVRVTGLNLSYKDLHHINVMQPAHFPYFSLPLSQNHASMPFVYQELVRYLLKAGKYQTAQ
jgi:hypothetical protein